ncbi:MAG: hypothetical protein KKA67_11585 [Spirochaetes bacterium]|nr:hypothetical protein [Spirochaetota bacterium]MBU1080385.1 hypothetical protein [Spirochaetota bacterium]
MISREEFIFTIGYDGGTAIVDGKAKAKYGKLGTVELAEAGLFRAAFASAVFSGSAEDLKAFADIYNAKAGTDYSTQEQFQRLFGVKQEKVKRVLAL